MLCVELAVLVSAVVPLLFNELQVVVEEVLARNQFAALPVCYVPAAVRVDERALSVELSFVKVAFVYDSVRIRETTKALLPIVLLRSFVAASRPL